MEINKQQMINKYVCGKIIYSVAVIVIVFPLGSSNLSFVFMSIIMTIPQANTIESIATITIPDQMAIEKYGMQCMTGPNELPFPTLGCT